MRRARLDDIPFITSLILHDAAKGHYKLAPHYEQSPDKLLGDLCASLIQHFAVVVQSERLEGELWIEEDNGHRAGAAVRMQASKDMTYLMRDAHTSELWMLSIHPDFRGRGIGSRLLNDFIARSPADNTLIARCADISVQMKAMLQRRHFHQLAQVNQDYALLVRGNTALIRQHLESMARPKPRTSANLDGLTVASCV